MTTKLSKTSLNSFNDKRLYVNNITSYPHDESLYLFKRDLLNKINTAPHELLIKLDKEKVLAINNIKQLTFNQPFLAYITLYNDLTQFLLT